MKKLVPFLLTIWVVIGSISFTVWWRIARNISHESVLAAANEILVGMEIPWSVNFDSVRPSYGAEFALGMNGVVFKNESGREILRGANLEVRIPWFVFLRKQPVRINVMISDIDLVPLEELQEELALYLNRKSSLEQTQIKLPAYIANSSFNIRLSKITTSHKANNIFLEKLYLINADPKIPTTFEMVFPWEARIGQSIFTFHTKLLGEYRLSKQKVDIHFFAKNKLQVSNAKANRNTDFVVEGKAVYGPKIGFFTTLSIREDWLSVVGDLEWSDRSFKINLPSIALSHDLFFDTTFLTQLTSASRIYENPTLRGEFRYSYENNQVPTVLLKLQNDKNAKMQTDDGPKSFHLNLKLGPQKNKFILSIDDREIISLADLKSEKVEVDKIKLFPFDFSKDFHKPLIDLMDTFRVFDWRKLSFFYDGKLWFEAYRVGVDYYDIKLSDFLDYGALSFRVQNKEIVEWSLPIVKKSLDAVMDMFSRESFTPAEHVFDGAVWSNFDNTKYKLQWKGSYLPILSKSNCRALISDRSDLKFLENDNFFHNLELDYVGGEFVVKKWVQTIPQLKVSINGSWSNSSVKCDLVIRLNEKSKREQVFEVRSN
jgi:hypothetical protein